MIKVGYFHIYEIPQLPPDFIKVKGARLLSISLAFDPPTRPTRGDSYLGVTMEFDLFKGIDREILMNAYEAASKTSSLDESTENTKKKLTKKYGAGIVVKLSPGSTVRKKGTLQRGQVEITPRATKYDDGPMTLIVSCNRKWANPDEIEMQRYALVACISHSDSQVDLYNRMRLQINQRNYREQERPRERV
ncbi:MAG: hypothetical protein V7L00_27665 [Nostoc sp.]|uniref:hypothetical protein n=1 Tax=Nostoc sp. TaxID=1180 RepID=UPI002FF60534